MKIQKMISCAALLMCAVMFMTSCGQTYHLQSIVMSPSYNALYGMSAYGTFAVKAQLSNGSTEDVTTKVTWALAAPSDSSSSDQQALLSRVRLTPGLANQVQVIGGICTWNWNPVTDSTGKTTSFTYGYHPFTITATYEGQTAIGSFSVNSIAGCYDPNHTAPTSDPGYTGPSFYD